MYSVRPYNTQTPHPFCNDTQKRILRTTFLEGIYKLLERIRNTKTNVNTGTEVWLHLQVHNSLIHCWLDWWTTALQLRYYISWGGECHCACSNLVNHSWRTIPTTYQMNTISPSVVFSESVLYPSPLHRSLNNGGNVRATKTNMTTEQSYRLRLMHSQSRRPAV